MIHKFTRDQYQKRFPELESLVPTPMEYVRTVKVLFHVYLQTKFRCRGQIRCKSHCSKVTRGSQILLDGCPPTNGWIVWFLCCRAGHETIKLFSCSTQLSMKFIKFKMPTVVGIFSSPEPLGSQGELIVYPCSGVRPSSSVRPSTISNIFSSETAWPIKAKFYVEPPWEGGTKVCINGPGHVTKMAAMPIYG